jgi:hypothetical protein
MGRTLERRMRRDYPLKAMQLMAEMGVGLDNAAALARVAEGLQGGIPECCLVFNALFYGRALDAGRHDLVAGYRTWMSNSGVGFFGYAPCPHCVIDGRVDRASTPRATREMRPVE